MKTYEIHHRYRDEARELHDAFGYAEGYFVEKEGLK